MLLHSYEYTSQEGGTWQKLYIPLEQDEVLWNLKANLQDGLSFFYGRTVHSMRNSKGEVFFDAAFGGPRP